VTSVAFAGAGWITAIHGLAVTCVPDVRVVHVASRQASHARDRARQTGAVACGYDDLPGGADLVVVATPPSAHLREARRAIDGGAVALVEAPLAATLADADLLVAAASAGDDPGGGRAAYGENLLYAPALARAVAACRQIGSPTYLEVRFVQGRPDWRGPPDPAWGGGVLFDLGAHAIAVALLLAAPARVVAVEARLTAGDGIEVDDDATATLTFDSGLRATVRTSWRAPAPAWDAQAATPEGAVRVELVPKPTAELNGVTLRLADPPAGLPSEQLHHLGYVGQLAAIAADVSYGRRPGAGLELGRTVLDIVCAAYLSGATGSPEPVPFTGPRDHTPHELWRGT
jgi:scyllo-inositol 2-dehydrogenase (NADP+)